MEHEAFSCEGLTAFSAVLLCTREQSKSSFQPLHLNLWEQGIVSWLEGAPRVIRNRLKAPNVADITKRLQEAASPTLLLIEATETMRNETVIDGITIIQETIQQLMPSVLITPGQSHSLRLENHKKVPNPDGWDLLMKDLRLRQLHAIDTRGKTPEKMLQEAVTHHKAVLMKAK